VDNFHFWRNSSFHLNFGGIWKKKEVGCYSNHGSAGLLSVAAAPS
jgi:hypothetical protein